MYTTNFELVPRVIDFWISNKFITAIITNKFLWRFRLLCGNTGNMLNFSHERKSRRVLYQPT